jgi:hypothetical protein
MRINELLEGKYFNDLEFVKNNGDKKDIDYDLVEDLAFFMNNDDDVFRNHVYHSVAKCESKLAKNQKTDASMFKTAVLESYKKYAEEYPIRELPIELDSKTCDAVCKKIHEDVVKRNSSSNKRDQ